MRLSGFENMDTQPVELNSRLERVSGRFLAMVSTLSVLDPKPSRVFQDALGIKSPDVRELVKYWRLHGEPISSTSKGYAYAHNQAELVVTISHIKERSIKMFQVASALERVKFDDQMKLL